MTVFLGGYPYPKPRDPRRWDAPEWFLRQIGARTAEPDPSGVLLRAPEPDDRTGTTTETPCTPS